MQMMMLILSLLALAVGPLLFQYFTYRPYWYRILDGLVVIMISGIVIIDVLPEIMIHHPLSGILLLGIGLMGPTILEHQFHRIAQHVHWVALCIGVLGLIAHAFVDGIVLSEISATQLTSESILGIGIILHRIPVGLTIWMLLLPRLGKWKAILTLAILALGTLSGYTFEIMVGHWNEGEGIIMFQALAAGSILHVVLHRPHEYHKQKMKGLTSPLMRYGEGIGNLVGLAFLVCIMFLPRSTGGHHHGGFLDFYGEMGQIFIGLALESAPALLLAYLIGGLVGTMLPATSIQWMRKGSPLVRSVKGVAIGLPLPICTCGVLPLYRSLIRRGAPPTAAMAFLIATPELGIDALLISIPLLGGDMTVIRLAAAAFIALSVGWVMGSLAERSIEIEESDAAHTNGGEKVSLYRRIRRGFSEGFGSLVDDTAPWIIVGLVVAALADPLLQNGWLQSLPQSIEVLFFALLGLPIYVCASGATPIVAVLLINSVSPGAAIAFLLTGPATNVSTYGILSQVHDRKIAILFGAMTTGVAVCLGYLVNLAIPYIDVLSSIDVGVEQASFIQRVSLVLLLLVFLRSLLRRGARAFVGEITSGFRSNHTHDHHSHEVEEKSCEHCAH